MATTDHIRYDLLAQDALRGVVKRVLADAVRNGLPGDHHFYISFRTGHPGVRISSRMREKYPEEITIVLQHQFWDLSVNETAFEVGLSFGNVPEALLVPYEAISAFFDPSVQFGLKFEVITAADEGKEPSAPEARKEPAAAPARKPSRAAVEAPPADRKLEVMESPGAAGGEGTAEKVVSLDHFRKKK